MAQIKKVVIEAGGKEFYLSLEEAKALRDILNSIIERDRHLWGPWVTWCDSTTLYCSSSR